ncbi:MAG: FAD-binding oxidoreductase, partial [Minisyncoccia bacterium]
MRPKLILFPKDSEDVKSLVKWVSQNRERYTGLSITARCAGTDMSGGAIGESIILDFTRYMNKLIGGPLPLDKKSEWEIAVQPGMFYRDFEKITLAKGLILPCFTASKTINAMGGMFGNNSAGERTLKYGKMEDFILSAKVVFADGNEYIVKPLNKVELDKKITQNDFEGNVYKNIFNLIDKNEDEIREAKPNVHKNSAGYYIWNVADPERVKRAEGLFNLNKLLVGSQGTLCIVTEMTLKILPDPKYTKLVVVFLRDVGLLPTLVNKILEFKPQSLESYDDKTFMLVLKYIKSFAQLLGFRNFFKLIWSFWPEAFMTLRHGLPKLVLLIELTGDSQIDVNNQAKKLLEVLKT